MTSPSLLGLTFMVSVREEFEKEIWLCRGSNIVLWNPLVGDDIVKEFWEEDVRKRK